MSDFSGLLPRSTSDDPSGLISQGDKQLFALNTVFLVFAVAAVALRLFSSRHRVPRFGLEDYLCVAALLAYAAQAGVTYVMILRGHLGLQDPTPTEESEYARMLTAVQFPYGWAMGFVRASIIVFQLRLFGVATWFRWLSYLTLVLVTAWTLMVTIVALVICTPIKYNWDKSVSGHCGNTTASYEAISGSGIVLDVMIFTAPLPIIWHLHTNMSRKILLTCFFAVGLFDIVTGAMRLYSTTQSPEADPVLRITWGILEPGIAIFVASAAHYNGIYNRLATKMDLAGHTLFSHLLSITTRFSGGSTKKRTEKLTESESSSENLPTVQPQLNSQT